MDNIWKLLYGIVNLATSFIIILIILGSIFTENIRSNVVSFFDMSTSMGIVGFYVLIIFIYMLFVSVSSISLAIINSKGLNKKFISTFFNVQSEKSKFLKWADRVIYIYLPLSIVIYFYFFL
ncbi:hypothetical protein OAJ69_02735 [Pseudomonadota bacterium]|nr:hypothetical protein [Pseudomonadota bacterium]